MSAAMMSRLPGNGALRWRLRAAALVVALAIAGTVSAHDALHDQIASATARIKRAPTDARLYVERAELHRIHQDWNAAIADYARAARLAPGDNTLDYLRGRMLLEAKRYDAARALLDAYVEQHPDHLAARVARARTLAALGEHTAATADYTHALARLPQPDPDLYVERARVEVAAGDVERALAGLDAGLARLGAVPALEDLALRLEIDAGHVDSALARLDRMTAAVARKEFLLARRGDLLMAAGRANEARVAYAATLVAIQALSAGARRTSAVKALEGRVRGALAGG